ncbi:class I SAM-dependent methyltransferase [Methylobacterium sp. NEAU 140]|uniref:class I SAM-dependent methyltransferase n=1 Tax=Methylobacterium sp. NEAU 140 TaxID=3064945 RepID=UPI002734734B|nr:class I SAM-dependent methyltransferase [Methylobacterium sp. NEAU 140]MDP4023178.1 class I SAM-dependent methyltransferase [Methylobacterium sp. NEAU 140]
MLKDLVQSAGRRAGVDIFRASSEPFRWSHTVHDYYPVVPSARWQPGTLPHGRLSAVLAREHAAYERFLDLLDAHADLLHAVPHEAGVADAKTPYWNNTWFTALDAAALVTMLAWKRPARYLEIGSGTSTRFARYAVDALHLPTQLTSIDPMPRLAIDALCDWTVRSPLEACDLKVFDELRAGDILFFDGSHRAFTNSDVTVFFFEVLPRLRPGVMVHIHDIFIPDDYPAAWNHRLYNEQYLLAAMLLCGAPPFRVSLPVTYVCKHAAYGARVRRAFAARGRRPDIPFLYPNDAGAPGASFWIETAVPGDQAGATP